MFSQKQRHHMFEGVLRPLLSFNSRLGQLFVGVQVKIEPLFSVFSLCPHHLYEPVMEYHDSTRHHYCSVTHTLYPKAVSDQPGTFHQHVLGLMVAHP